MKAQFIPRFFDGLGEKVYTARCWRLTAWTCGRSRGMRSERRDAIRAVVSALLGRVNLQAGGLVVQLSADGREAVPLTVEKLADVADIGARRTKRVLYNMRNAGLIEVTPQYKVHLAICRRRSDKKLFEE